MSEISLLCFKVAVGFSEVECIHCRSRLSLGIDEDFDHIQRFVSLVGGIKILDLSFQFSNYISDIGQ